MAQQLTWRKAIEKVLSETSGAIHYTDISDKIIEKNQGQVLELHLLLQ